MNSDSKILLTYTLGGSVLVSKGVYSTAKIYVKNGFTKKEVFKLEKPSKTIVRPEFTTAHQTTILGSAFIDNALTKPEKPYEMNIFHWIKTPLGKLAKNWNQLTEMDKIRFHVDLYANDMNAVDYSFEYIK